VSRKPRQNQAAPEKPREASASAAGPDVGQLAAEKLGTGSFPAPRSIDFRVYIDPQVYAATLAHAAEDTTFEICGVLVGDLSRDSDGPFVNVRNYIRCDSAEKKFAEVTFTHESWAHINREMDTKYQDQRIVGWYHSHPNFGIFLSDRDFFIQQNFFSGPGQIALVIDPVRKIEGVFEWRNGGTAPTPHYWVGPRLQLAPSGPGATEMPESMPADSLGNAGPPPPAQPLGMATTMLAALCLFLLGWLLSGWISGAERRAVIEGTVAHFGLWKGLRPGLEEGLASLQSRLRRVSDQARTLSENHLKRSSDAISAEKDEAARAALQKTADKLNEDWRATRNLLTEMGRELEHLQLQYAWTPEEREAVIHLLVRKQIELQALEAATRDQANGAEPSPPKPAAKAEKKEPAKK